MPLIAIVTKIDELDRSALIDKLIEINEFADFTDIVPVSALEHDNLAEVRNVLVENMPEGPQMYPAEQITEERPEDTIAELIRGAFLEELDDELPHSLAVVVDSIEYPEDNDSGESYAGKAQVIVSIYVERDSQKPIIIGHNAEHLVRVKKKLRTAVNRIVGQKAKLDLHVKVAKGWQSDPKQRSWASKPLRIRFAAKLLTSPTVNPLGCPFDGSASSLRSWASDFSGWEQ